MVTKSFFSIFRWWNRIQQPIFHLESHLLQVLSFLPKYGGWKQFLGTNRYKEEKTKINNYLHSSQILEYYSVTCHFVVFFRADSKYGMIFDIQWVLTLFLMICHFSTLFNRDFSVKQKSETLWKWVIFGKDKKNP